MNKIYVVCPGGLTTGGAELLHQLVHQLRIIGKECYISYLPQNKIQEVPSQYTKYNVTPQLIEDDDNNLIIFPEICTRYSKKLRKAKAAIWWLSVDNYYRFPQNNTTSNPLLVLKNNKFYDVFRYINARVRNRSLSSMKDMLHLTQSKYAEEFLSKNGINSYMLGDYLSEEHFLPIESDINKRNIIAYNPKKGGDITNRLIKMLPEYQFIPIQNLTSSGVASLLRSAKVYIDFGHHPGKDRPPREAVMAGCCVILGQSGSANNSFDYPINKRYKISSTDHDFINKIKLLIENIFNNYQAHSVDYAEWRSAIKQEKEEFEKQVKAIFG